MNHKTYYFMVIAYGFTPTLVNPDYAVPRDYLPFISGNFSADGRTNISAIPHTPSPEAGGTEAHSTYGTGPKLTRIEGHGNGGQVLDLTSGTVSEILGASARSINPVYEQSHGPVNIKVVDPLSVPKENSFEFKLLGTTSAATWQLINLTTNDTVNSDKTIALANEQIINGQPSGVSTYTVPTWGLSVNVAFTADPLTTNAIEGGFLEATMTFGDNTKQWLTGLADEEGESHTNWIRSGSAVGTIAAFNDATGTGTDPNQDYENILGKTWAPYRVCATGLATEPTTTSVYTMGAPAWPTNISLNKTSNLASVDVVITADKSLWTRCPVLEESDDNLLSEGNARKLMMRDAPSVDKNGVANFGSSPDNSDFPTGMGWFPGYVINLETGERLNMAFGEDSWLTTENGNDMKWNPTTKKFGSTATIMSTTGPIPDPVFGGKHYIYIFGHNGDALFPSTDALLPSAPRDIPRYDNGRVLHDLLFAANSLTGTAGDPYKREAFSDAMWVNVPMLAPGHSLLESTVKIRLRVAKSYQKGYTANVPSSVDTALTPQNVNWPMYTFNTAEIETHKGDNELAVNALDLINVVPNPYYAYSAYERKALENIVKITNLPEKCDISIYSLNGTLIRKFSKDDPKTSLDWDLKNQARIPIASGMYIIYIKVPDVGEKTLKWFGVLRPTDLDSY
ncbi:MAG: T9SS type A sorting domain-containing protein [Bacteroidetes bacterium]|nr:T9SS type A sorting domain-containing protein [Bacteroidota bacterium]